MAAHRGGRVWRPRLLPGMLLAIGVAATAATGGAAQAAAVWRDRGAVGSSALGVLPTVAARDHEQIVAALVRARDDWQAAANAGDPVAQHNLAVAYVSGPPPLRNEAGAAAWFLRAARQGFVPAQIDLGRLYWLGLGVERDHEAAARWWRAAALRGSDAAAANLALLLDRAWNPPLPRINTQTDPAPWVPPVWPLP
ncbi:MAG: sel1 repeat family protein [Rhodospirillales bacterium]|nr:sel1 repeat family protein [Rhodospirillales bacterium]